MIDFMRRLFLLDNFDYLSCIDKISIFYVVVLNDFCDCRLYLAAIAERVSPFLTVYLVTVFLGVSFFGSGGVTFFL